MSTLNPITNDTVTKSYEVLAILGVCRVACENVRQDHLGEDVGNINLAISAAHRLAGEVHDIVETHALPAAPARAQPADPIFDAFAKMDAASDYLDKAAEEEGYDPRNSPAFRLWEDAAVAMGYTVPTTKAGLIALLQRAAADIERGPSVWQRNAVDSAASAVATLLDGGAHG